MATRIFAAVATTTLNPDQGCILEVALAATDEDLNVQDSTCIVLKPSQFELEQYILPMGDKVLKMHTENGLLEALTQATMDAQWADDELLKWVIRQKCSSKALTTVDGSFDRAWISQYLPQLSQAKPQDHSVLSAVSALKGLLEVERPSYHNGRAADDVRYTLEYLRNVRSAVTESITQAYQLGANHQ